MWHPLLHHRWPTRRAARAAPHRSALRLLQLRQLLPLQPASVHRRGVHPRSIASHRSLRQRRHLLVVVVEVEVEVVLPHSHPLGRHIIITAATVIIIIIRRARRWAAHRHRQPLLCCRQTYMHRAICIEDPPSMYPRQRPHTPMRTERWLPHHQPTIAPADRWVLIIYKLHFKQNFFLSMHVITCNYQNQLILNTKVIGMLFCCLFGMSYTIAFNQMKLFHKY